MNSKNNKNVKNITIEYYNTSSFTQVTNKTNTYARDKIDISLLLTKLQEKSVQERTIQYNGENLLLSSIEFNNNSNLWELIFFKSRSSTIPFIINRNGNSRQIILNDDEMISEALCIIYEPSTRILAMQRNVYAVGTKGIESFFSHFSNMPIILDSLHSIDSEKKCILKRSKIKKFKLNVRNVKKKDGTPNSITQYNKNTSICKVIDSALAVNSTFINIEFSMGNTSNTIEVEDEDFEVFEHLMNNNNVKTLELGCVPDEKATMQITDFMDSRIHDLISIPYKKGEALNFTEILNKMTDKFRKNLYLE